MCEGRDLTTIIKLAYKTAKNLTIPINWINKYQTETIIHYLKWFI